MYVCTVHFPVVFCFTQNLNGKENVLCHQSTHMFGTCVCRLGPFFVIWFAENLLALWYTNITLSLWSSDIHTIHYRDGWACQPKINWMGVRNKTPNEGICFFFVFFYNHLGYPWAWIWKGSGCIGTRWFLCDEAGAKDTFVPIQFNINLNLQGQSNRFTLLLIFKDKHTWILAFFAPFGWQQHRKIPVYGTGHQNLSLHRTVESQYDNNNWHSTLTRSESYAPLISKTENRIMHTQITTSVYKVLIT